MIEKNDSYCLTKDHCLANSMFEMVLPYVHVVWQLAHHFENHTDYVVAVISYYDVTRFWLMNVEMNRNLLLFHQTSVLLLIMLDKMMKCSVRQHQHELMVYVVLEFLLNRNDRAMMRDQLNYELMIVLVVVFLILG